MLGKAGLLVTVNRTCLDLSFMACLCSFKALVRDILFRSCNFLFFFKCSLYTRFAEHLRSKKLSVEQIRCKGRARL